MVEYRPHHLLILFRLFLKSPKSFYRFYREKRSFASALSKIGDRAFFIQVGSNDGFAGDPLHSSITSKHWSEIMIEPVPHIFKKLQAQYKDNNSIILLETAIAPESANLKFYTIPDDIEDRLGEKLPNWHNQLSSFKRENLVNHLDGKLEPFIYSIDIPTNTLTELIDLYSVTSIDVLHVDVEGFDYEVFTTFPLGKLKPRLIVIEHKHMLRDNLDALLGVLKANNYRTTMLSSDLLAQINS